MNVTAEGPHIAQQSGSYVEKTASTAAALTIAASDTITGARILRRYILVDTTGGNVTLTIDTGANLDSAFVNMRVNDAIEFGVLHYTVTANSVTVTLTGVPPAGITYLGITGSDVTLTSEQKAWFALQKTAANTFRFVLCSSN